MRPTGPMLALACLMGITSAPASAQSTPPAAPAPAKEPAKTEPAKNTPTKAEPTVGNTVENLQAANGDATRNVALMDAYAKKADTEGYTQVGSLFRAIKRSHEILKSATEDALKKAGSAPKADDKTPLPEVKSTRENLEAAMKAAKAAKDSTLIAYRRKASEDRNKDADSAFRYMRESLIEHARYMEVALDTLPQTRSGKKDYYVNRVCGYMVEKLDIKKCPVCSSDRDKFEKVN